MTASLPLIRSLPTYQDLRVLVLRENWIGNTGLSLFNALLRAGVWAASISEGEYIPLKWEGLPMKSLARTMRSRCVRQFNRALLREAEIVQPHLFIAVKGTFVKPESLRGLRKMGATSFCFFPDVSFMSHGKYLVRALPEYDWVFTTKSFGPKDFSDAFHCDKISFLPHAFDPQVHQPRMQTRELLDLFEADVSFVGAWSPKKEMLLEGLIRARPNLKLNIWGNSWNRLSRSSPLRPFTMFKPIIGIGYASAISCSKVNLGLLSEKVHGASSGDRITSRTFHIPACGGLLLHERTDDLLEIFEENVSCVCFDGVEELAKKVDWLLSNEERRVSIAEHGQKVVAAGHSWDHRAHAIVTHYLQYRAKGQFERSC